jgi:hypothetical protein
MRRFLSSFMYLIRIRRSRPRPPYDTLWGAPGSKERLAELRRGW